MEMDFFTSHKLSSWDFNVGGQLILISLMSLRLRNLRKSAANVDEFLSFPKKPKEKKRIDMEKKDVTNAC